VGHEACMAGVYIKFPSFFDPSNRAMICIVDAKTNSQRTT